MKAKKINTIICKKFDEYTSSIKDERVKKLVIANTVITGGCIASMLLKEKVNDYDLYFTNKETVKAVAEYYVKQFNDKNDEDGYVLDGAIPNVNSEGGAALNMTPDRIKIIFDSNGIAKEKGFLGAHELGERMENQNEDSADINEEYRPIYLSCNAITLSHQIQIVIRFYGEPMEIHDNYDYVHCTNYWSSKDREVYLNQNALESLLAKELKYIGSKYPLASIIRMRKFINRGWTINAGQILKMGFQLSLLDLTNIEVLEDQLVGVDVAYFNTLIDALKNRPGNEEQTLTYGYLAAIVDKIF